MLCFHEEELRDLDESDRPIRGWNDARMDRVSTKVSSVTGDEKSPDQVLNKEERPRRG